MNRRYIQDAAKRVVLGLYSDEIVDDLLSVTSQYMKGQEKSYALNIPSSLHGATSAREMTNPVVIAPQKPVNDFFREMGICDGKIIKGPLNRILARMITIPMMISGYMNNYPSPQEREIYTDPPLLQRSPDELKRLYDTFFAAASEKLEGKTEMLKRFASLGIFGDFASVMEKVYPSRTSTEAYELFGIFHLFPSNQVVDITATSPGVILPTEADPLRFKDSVLELRKNLLRPTYFEMLKNSVNLNVRGGRRRARRYSASRSGTAESLAEYPQLVEAAKGILQGYLGMENRFQIRLGKQDPRMKLATLIGDAGVVYSVRDKDEKKITHNVTVIDAVEAARQREIFDEQWARGEPIIDAGVIDRLVAEFGQKQGN
jgi:hypothetical protein